MQARYLVRNIVTALSIILVASVLIGGTRLRIAMEAPASSPVARTAVPKPMVAVPTGEYEKGVPVYRLPSIAVTVSRSAELAKMAREEQLAAK